MKRSKVTEEYVLQLKSARDHYEERIQWEGYTPSLEKLLRTANEWYMYERDRLYGKKLNS